MWLVRLTGCVDVGNGGEGEVCGAWAGTPMWAEGVTAACVEAMRRPSGDATDALAAAAVVVVLLLVVVAAVIAAVVEEVVVVATVLEFALEEVAVVVGGAAGSAAEDDASGAVVAVSVEASVDCFAASPSPCPPCSVTLSSPPTLDANASEAPAAATAAAVGL